MKKIIVSLCSALTLCWIFCMCFTLSVKADGSSTRSAQLYVDGNYYSLYESASGDNWEYDGNGTLSLNNYNKSDGIIYYFPDLSKSDGQILTIDLTGTNTAEHVVLGYTDHLLYKVQFTGSGSLSIDQTFPTIMDILSGTITINKINDRNGSNILVKKDAVLNVNATTTGFWFFNQNTRLKVNGGVVNCTTSGESFLWGAGEPYDSHISLVNGGILNVSTSGRDTYGGIEVSDNATLFDNYLVTDFSGGAVTTFRYSATSNSYLISSVSSPDIALQNIRITSNQVELEEDPESEEKKSELACSLSSSILVYTGSQCKPTITVTDENGNFLQEGTDYTLSYSSSSSREIGRYYVTVIPGDKFSGGETFEYVIVPNKPSNLSVICYQYGNQIFLSWDKKSGASGYRIEWKVSGASSYKLLANTKNLNYIKGSLKANQKYSFKVTPYYEIDGTKYYGTSSSCYKTISITTATKGKKLVQVKKPTASVSGKKVKVKWKSIKNVSGYQISKSTSKTGIEIVSTYKTTSGSYKLISASKGKTYYYRVRAYRIVNKQKIYGEWSSPRKFKR
ncbi:MAG: hypothetical protein ACI4S2_09085 [Lachnospiraceae bacterium]